MKIDWKYFAQTPGYLSLKATYVKAVKRCDAQNNPEAHKERMLHKFHWILSRAKHYAQATNTPIWKILDAWESARTYGWLNFYQESNQPKLHSNSLEPRGLRGVIKQAKRAYAFDPKIKKKYLLQYRQQLAREKSTRIKPRWSKYAKDRAKQQRENQNL